MPGTFSHYTLSCITQTKAHSATDTNPKIRLYGSNGVSSLYYEMDSTNHDDGWEAGKDRKDICHIKTDQDLGKIYAIEISLDSSNIWRPAEITVWRVDTEKHYSNKSVFQNLGDNYASTNKNLELHIPLIDDVQPVPSSTSSTTVESSWIVKDFRGKDSPIPLTLTELVTLVNKTIKSTEEVISQTTGLKIANETTISSDSLIGASIDSKFSTEFSNELTKKLTTHNMLESSQSIALGSSADYQFEAHRLIFFRYTIKTMIQKANIIFYDGSAQEVVIPLYNQWSGFSEVPSEWKDIQSDSDMTQELKDAYKEYFGRDWTPETY